jgi:2-polyprenyl-3-methyl-5-hydroxy-6-metoxy-1,4-benzoquinol methylase
MQTCIICASDQALNQSFRFHHYHVCICPNCGFHWLDPQPTEAELSNIYTDHYFLDEGQPEITELVNQLKRATARLYLEQLVQKDGSSPSGLSLLEIGCGMGDFLLEAQAEGFKVSGLEVTDHLVEFANRRLGVSSIQKGFIETANFQNESFDIIAFFDVIEHVRNPVDFMGRVQSLLKKNGKVFLVTPSLDSWSAKLLGKNWMEYKVEHLSYFNNKSLSLLLEKAGFHHIRFLPNYKILNFDYINRHFVRFPVKGISPLLKVVRTLVPDRLAYLPVKVVASGMAVIADKQQAY